METKIKIGCDLHGVINDLPYEFIPEDAFSYIFERFTEYSFGVPRDIIQLTNLLKEDYPKYKRISKINTIL